MKTYDLRVKWVTHLILLALQLSTLKSFCQNDSPPPMPPLNTWSLSVPPWTSDMGDPARGFAGLNTAPSWSDAGTCLSVGGYGREFLNFNVFESVDNWVNITVATNGSLTFWYQPNFTSVADGGSGPGGWAALINIGSYTTNGSVGDWLLAIDAGASNLCFFAESQGRKQVVFEYPIDMDEGDWWMIGICWSATNTCLYLNGQLATNAGPILYRPNHNECLQYGFFVGSLGTDGSAPAMGQFQDLLSFGYPVSTQEVSGYYSNVSSVILDWGGTIPAPSLPIIGLPGEGMDDSDSPPPGPGGMGNSGTNGGTGGLLCNYVIPTNGLWMSPAGVSNGTTWFNLNNATNYVYEIFSAANLGDPWNIEAEVFADTNHTSTPFWVEPAGRGNLYVWARDWTGITANGNQTPQWWFYKYFGAGGLNLSDNDMDSSGWNTLRYDYLNGIDPNVIAGFNVIIANQYVNQTNATFQITNVVGIPCYMTALVDNTNLADAQWVPCSSNITSMTASLGTNQGWHQIWLGLRGFPATATPAWNWLRVKLDTIPPRLVITNPVSTTVMQPMIQVQGYCSETVNSLTYDLCNAAGQSSNQQAFVVNAVFSTNTFESTTNVFQAYDIPLAAGANVLTFHATDLAGNVTTTNFTFTLSYAGRTNPPVIQLYWPQNGTQIGAGSFTMRGMVDDFTTTLQATIRDSSGDTNSVSALVERDGKFWLENLPLAAGTNVVTLTAMDAASNVTTTNITVVGSSLSLAMNGPDSSGLWQMNEDVSGTISDTNYYIWVNGVEATNNGDGTWNAYGVPVTVGGTAVFQMRAIPCAGGAGSGSGGNGTTSYANPGNPPCANAVDAEVPQDKPSRMYGSKYNLQFSDSDSGQEPNDTWSDLAIENITWSDGGPGLIYYYDWDYSTTFWGYPVNESTYERILPPGYWNNSVTASNLYFGSGNIGMPFTNTSSFWVTFAQEHCDVNWPTVASSPNYYYTETQVRKAQMDMSFDTGGKAIPGMNTIYAFYMDAPVADLSGANTPIPTNITLGSLGLFDWTGNIYLSLPGGVTTMLTPFVPGLQYYSFGLGVKGFPPCVLANGYSLSQFAMTFCAGQQVTFNLACGDLPLTNVYCNWQLGGQFVNALSNESGGVYYVDRSRLGGNSNICNCWYYDGTNGTALVGANVIVNGKSYSTAAKGTFGVYRPTLTNWTLPTPPNPSFVSMYFSNWIAGEVLRVGDTNTNGCIQYSVNINSIYPGTAIFTQTYDDESYPTSWGSNALDTAEIYPCTGAGYPAAPLTVMPSSTSLNILALNSSRLEQAGGEPMCVFAMQARDYARFRPSMGYSNDNIYVTLGKVTWSVNASAGWTNGVWTLSPRSAVTGPVLTTSDEWPYWTSVH